MICIFFELPYQRQVKKIFTTKFSECIDSIINLSAINGGTYFFEGSKYFFCFNSTSIAYEFSSVRFLFLLHSYLHENISLIETFRVIIDIVDDAFSEQEIKNHFEKTRTILLDENFFYATKLVYQKLSGYAKFDTNGRGIFKITDFLIFNSYKQEDEKTEKLESLVLHKHDTFFWSMYNFILQHPIIENDLHVLSRDEQFTYNQVKNCTVFFRQHRFEKKLPEYFTDAFFMYASLYFKVYTKKNNSKLPIIYSGDLRNEQLNAEIEKILAIIPGAEVRELSKKLPDISEIHDDMLCLIFLTTIFSKYLFVDEVSEFFISLNKASDFFSDVYIWLYENGIIFEKNNLYAHSTHLSDFVESHIKNKTFDIYDQLSRFLIKKYNAGFLKASEEFFEILKFLNYKDNDEIILTNFLSSHSFDTIVTEDIETRYTDRKFIKGLLYYQNAIQFFNNQKYEKSLHQIKYAISEFKYSRCNVGEYKCMFFLGLLSLCQDQLNDAINYFVYAQDIAQKINDPYFLCEVIYYLGITYFLKNDLTLALRITKKLEEIIETQFVQDWKIYYLFLKGRVHAEMGEYKIAEQIFYSAFQFSSQYFEQYLSVSEIWYARMLHFSGEKLEAKKILEKNLDVHADAILFFIESHFTVPILKDESQNIFGTDVSEFSPDQLIEFLEVQMETQKQTKLVSGFSFIEDLASNSKKILSTTYKLIKIFFLYYRCKVLLLNLLNSENKKQAEVLLKQLLSFSNKAVAEKDIYAHLFFYFCYDISSKLNGENSAETISYLSKCFKLLQSRVMATGDNTIRDSYMSKNFWNIKILTQAKNQKLL